MSGLGIVVSHQGYKNRDSLHSSFEPIATALVAGNQLFRRCQMDKDLIDHLGIYKARTLPRRAYHYCVSTRAAQELPDWPALDVIDAARGGVPREFREPRNGKPPGSASVD